MIILSNNTILNKEMLSEFRYVYKILNRTNNPIPIHNVKMKLRLLVSNMTVANKERNVIVNKRRLPAH